MENTPPDFGKMYTSDIQAKSYLMENTPPDFESYFYSGVKITCSAQQIKLIDTSGTIHNFRYSVRYMILHHTLKGSVREK